MSNPDERLSDLLAQRARQGSGVHPTREGVSVAVTRRAARRRRKRAVVTGLAGLCLVAGVVGGLALAGDDDGQQDGFTTPTGPLPEVPLVGMNINDFELTSTETAPLDTTGSPDMSIVVFRAAGSLAGPQMSVTIDPDAEYQAELLSDEEGTAVDLDADGQADDPDDGWLTSTPGGGTSVTWQLDDGRIAAVGGFGLDEETTLAYVSSISAGSLDLATLPAPPGLPDRSITTVPSGLDTERATVTYQRRQGEIQVTTTNEPGWFDLMQLYSSSTYDGFEAAEVGESFLGPSRAILSEPAPGRPYALVLTDSGLTIEIATDDASGFGTDDLRALLADGAFVEVEPTEGPPTTTALAPATTAPPVTSTSTSVVPSPQGLPSVTRTVDERGEHLTIEFDRVPPALGALTMLESLTGDCARFEDDFERIFRENGDEPYWQGWLTVELQTQLIGIAGPVFGVPALGSAEDSGYILCADGALPATIAIPIANLGEPIVTPLSGRPAYIIDIPR